MTKGAITVDKIPGGRYTCQNNGDGTWNILDVPIMGEMFEGEKGVPFDLGTTWHEAALRKAEEREEGGHWGSVHVNHHERGLRTERAGYLRLRRVGTLAYEGREMSCLYADLIRVPRRIFDLIDRGELPYMSVEVASWEEPEIASLAIMPDETPFFRLPMLTTGKKVQADEPIRFKNCPAAAYANAGAGGFILFKLGGPMKPAKKPAKSPITSLSAEELAKKEELENLTSLRELIDARLADKEVDTELLHKLLAKLDDRKEDEAEEKDEKETEGAEDEAAVEDKNPGAAFGRAPVEQGEDNVKEIAKLSADIDALKAKDAKREREDKIASIVAKAHEDLRGYFLSADTKAKIKKFAEKDLTGETVADFVATYKTVASPDETDHAADASHRMASSPAAQADEPEALAKLAAKGPEAHARGREIHREFLHAKESGHVPASMTFERYLDINLSLPALRVRK